jgi:hypothetical protein
MARLAGKNLALFTVGAQTLLARIRQCSVEKSFSTQDNRALLDAVEYNEAVIQTFRVSWTQAVESTVNNQALLALIGTEVAFEVQTGDVTYTCTGALLNGFRHDVPDGLQEMSFELVPRGNAMVSAGS